jgi:hypothetical protein
MTSNQRLAMLENIRHHGENLVKLFNLPESTDTLALCKKLRRLENQAHREAENYCNGYSSLEFFEDYAQKTVVKVNRILNNENNTIPIFVNGDPRGYALKIASENVFRCSVDYYRTFYRDLGGYGIIAPDFTPG